MRVIYDKTTGRVATLGDAVEPGAGQVAADLTPDESAALATAVQAVADLTAQLREATATEQAARAVYAEAAAARRSFAAAEAGKADGQAVGFDPRRRGFIVVAGEPAPEPTPEEDEALVLGNPALAALARYLARNQGKG